MGVELRPLKSITKNFVTSLKGCCCCWFAPSQLWSNRPALLRKATDSPRRSQKIARRPRDPKDVRSQRSERSPRRPPRLPGATEAKPQERRQRPSRTSKDPRKNNFLFFTRPPAGGFCGHFADRTATFSLHRLNRQHSVVTLAPTAFCHHEEPSTPVAHTKVTIERYQLLRKLIRLIVVGEAKFYQKTQTFSISH